MPSVPERPLDIVTPPMFFALTIGPFRSTMC